ncbi:DNA alkylation repair protein [Paenibacillus solisilvae]|uniref:DNA alkylation repair protein n=1 Tax=Paenibacillus solisilvae TaxID=2486751 RepID=A0ABW0W3Q4_9BACL
MAEPLKAMYNQSFITAFGALVQSGWAEFDAGRFVGLTLDKGWEQLELKGRMRRITESLGSTLPADYKEALGVLYAIDERCVGFPYLFFPDFVEVYGLGEWELSMHALERFTARSSAEFAIRPFILAQTDRTMARMLEWAASDNEHVRRLATEGCRPRLPWAPALPMFKRDPSAILPILEQLKCDPSLYVRKSVANNMNDIAKDHPDIVRDLAARWTGRHEWTDWIIRRGCRSLLKAADPSVMAFFGYEGDAAADSVEGAALVAREAEVSIGEKSELNYWISLRSEEPLRLRVELGVDYVKASGKASQKRFLLIDRTVAASQRIEGLKQLDWKDLTTRKHYPGVHQLHLLVNGQAVADTAVTLHAEAQGQVRRT